MENKFGNLFGVKDTKTGEIYYSPYKLAQNTTEDLKKIFRPHQFIIDDAGDIYIENTMDESTYLDRERFKVVWNYNHNCFRETSE